MSGKVSIRIRYDRRSGLVALLTLALLVVALLGYLAWGRDEVAASGPQPPLDQARNSPLAASAGLRGYYLTQGMYNGADADGTDGNGAGVCAEGYHFASLWEILDPSTSSTTRTWAGLGRQRTGATHLPLGRWLGAHGLRRQRLQHPRDGQLQRLEQQL
jgi:hypothetical protein